MSEQSVGVMHIVLFKWKESATPAEIRTIVEELRGLQSRRPGIAELSCGENFSDRAQGFTHGLCVRFTDRAALEVYGPHPEHQRVVQNFINPVREDVLVCDYTL